MPRVPWRHPAEAKEGSWAPTELALVVMHHCSLFRMKFTDLLVHVDVASSSLKLRSSLISFPRFRQGF
jgi:hypothetical protein